MKAVVIDGEWGPEHMRVVERPDPEPSAEDVVIAIEAVSINPRDLILSRGGYGRFGGTLPLVPLCDGTGRIVAKGASVTGLEIGDRVCPTYSRSWLDGPYRWDSFEGAHGGPLDGTMCERTQIPAAAVVKAPAHLTAEEAATLPCAAVTAWNAIVEQGATRPGDRVLVQGTGGVALFALQFAKSAGAEVFLISSSDERLELGKGLGADHGINYRETTDWHKAVLALTDGVGVDHIVEVGGADTLAKSTACVRPSGVISLIGVLGGAEASFNLGRVVTRNLRLQGVTVGSRAMFARMVRAMEINAIRPMLDKTRFSFDGLPDALRRLPEGGHTGKIVGVF
ncbi:MAG: NAD(P)-dependent alcohol dehydrogenase [Alphaproteobacteria bacterium]|nr:NAD(P)-dependent alcohol dehydrogenase [Alphaproteobacteria bacterium]